MTPFQKSLLIGAVIGIAAIFIAFIIEPLLKPRAENKKPTDEVVLTEAAEIRVSNGGTGKTIALPDFRAHIWTVYQRTDGAIDIYSGDAKLMVTLMPNGMAIRHSDSNETANELWTEISRRISSGHPLP